VDLVVKQGSGLRAFEIKWSAGRASSRAFRAAYGVEVEPPRSDTTRSWRRYSQPDRQQPEK